MATKKSKKAASKKKATSSRAHSRSTKKSASSSAKAKSASQSASSAGKSKPIIVPEAQAFIAQLAKKQDRAWFATRKSMLAELLHGPIDAILREVGARVLDAFPEVEDRAPKVFRIYRDVRFSKDKAPFKDHAAGQLAIGRTSIYVHVDGKRAFAAAGPWQMEPDELKAFRLNVAHTDLGPELESETKRLEKKGFEHASIDELARAPAGIDPAHPCIRLLKHKGYALMFPAPSPKQLVTGAWPALIAAQLLDAKKALKLVEQAMAPVAL